MAADVVWDEERDPSNENRRKNDFNKVLTLDNIETAISNLAELHGENKLTQENLESQLAAVKSLNNLELNSDNIIPDGTNQKKRLTNQKTISEWNQFYKDTYPDFIDEDVIDKNGFIKDKYIQMFDNWSEFKTELERKYKHKRIPKPKMPDINDYVMLDSKGVIKDHNGNAVVDFKAYNVALDNYNEQKKEWQNNGVQSKKIQDEWHQQIYDSMKPWNKLLTQIIEKKQMTSPANVKQWLKQQPQWKEIQDYIIDNFVPKTLFDGTRKVTNTNVKLRDNDSTSKANFDVWDYANDTIINPKFITHDQNNNKLEDRSVIKNIDLQRKILTEYNKSIFRDKNHKINPVLIAWYEYVNIFQKIDNRDITDPNKLQEALNEYQLRVQDINATLSQAVNMSNARDMKGNIIDENDAYNREQLSEQIQLISDWKIFTRLTYNIQKKIDNMRTNHIPYNGHMLFIDLENIYRAASGQPIIIEKITEQKISEREYSEKLTNAILNTYSEDLDGQGKVNPIIITWTNHYNDFSILNSMGSDKSTTDVLNQYLDLYRKYLRQYQSELREAVITNHDLAKKVNVNGSSNIESMLMAIQNKIDNLEDYSGKDLLKDLDDICVSVGESISTASSKFKKQLFAVMHKII